MPFPRSSGVLLHPTSLPGRFGIGDLGPERASSSSICSPRPASASGRCCRSARPATATRRTSASPRSPATRCSSASTLIEDGLLDGRSEAVAGNAGAFAGRRRRLPRRHRPSPGAVAARARSIRRGRRQPRCAIASSASAARNARWLDDFALFMAVKDAHGRRRGPTWEPDIAAARSRGDARDGRPAARARSGCTSSRSSCSSSSGSACATACHARSIAIMGDLPIFVAHDSADVWARRELFRLDADGRPTVVAGVPPDYFSATGQLWGNPLYAGTSLERTGYAWWIERFRALLDAGRSRAPRSLPRVRGVVGSAGATPRRP